jgi:hypothetical protein
MLMCGLLCLWCSQGLRTSSLPEAGMLAKLAAGAHSTAATAAAAEDSPVGPAQPFKRQLLECTRKLTLAYWRMPAYNLLRLLMTVACAIVSSRGFGCQRLCAATAGSVTCETRAIL